MKLLKIATTILVLCGILLISASCTSGATASTAKTQTAAVQKGNLSVAVTGTGNLALSRSEDLAFEIAGYVQEILVKESQSVKEGDILAKLDTSDWDKQLKTLEKAVTAAERNLLNKEEALLKAERQVAAKELAVKQAQVDMETAEYNLTQIEDVKEAQDTIDDIEERLKLAELMLESASKSQQLSVDATYWRDQIKYLNADLVKAKKDKADIISNNKLSVTTDVKILVSKSQMQVEQSQKSLEDAQVAVNDANTAIANAKLDKRDAEQALKDAQADLEEANSKSPIVKAPFSGFITKILVNGGDEVFKGTVAMQLADPEQFEANIMVTEKDVFSIKVDGDATVSIDALAGVSFPAKITAIAPLATTQSGVVSYKVTVKLTSLQPSTNASSKTTATSTLPATTNNTAVTQKITLKSGLTATISIVTQKKENVLMIPNRAITKQGQNSTVQVVKGETTETRAVKAGMSDNMNTEITDGLSEGEQVQIKSAASSGTAKTTTTQQGPGGIPGMGGPPPGGF